MNRVTKADAPRLDSETWVLRLRCRSTTMTRSAGTTPGLRGGTTGSGDLGTTLGTTGTAYIFTYPRRAGGAGLN